jgi:predicted RNase H-like nuclease (RuvC/YqgF family)
VSTRTDALETVVFGVDVQSGDVRGSSPSYALVRYDGAAIERDVVTGRKLRRLIDDRAPAIVATDNVYELAADKDALIGFLRDLPDGTRLVQVTGDERPESLSRVAHRHDVPYDSDPMSEAEAAARLAAANVGQVVSAFTDTTEIKVSRGRSTGKGGWSEDRHTRRMHGAIKRRAREVETALDDAGLDYERSVTEKYGGFANATFRVEARPEDIPVSAERRSDVRVEVERERGDGIEYTPLARRRDHVLVGIDPGTTTAAALVSLDGEVLDRLSTRTADTGDVIEWIVERGRPVLVAADVTPMPDTVERFRRSFDAAGWTPTNDLPIDEKQHRTRDVGYDNDHERDAIAAALFAHDDHADQFERIADKVPPGIDRGAVTARVLGGEESVEVAIAALTEDDEEESTDDPQPPAEPSPEQRHIRRLERQIDRLEDKVASLEDTVEEKDERIESLESDLREARSEQRTDARERRAVSRLRRENDRLERDLEREREQTTALEDKLDRLKALWKLDHSNFADVDPEKRDLVPVKPIAKFTDDAITAAQDAYGLAPDDVLYLRDATGAGRTTAERLADLDPHIVLTEGGLSDATVEVFFERAVPHGPAADVTIQEVDDLAVARESEVDAVRDDWADRHAERKRERNAELVDKVISEHRAERGSGD